MNRQPLVVFLLVVLLNGCVTGRNKTSEVHNIASYDQSGGITAHTVNFQKPDRHLTPDFIRQLNNTLPANRKAIITVSSVMGDQEALQFGAEIKDYLQKQGWTIHWNVATVYPQPVFGQIIERKDDDNLEIIIGSKR